MKLTHDDEMIPPKSHSTQIASVTKPVNIKVVLRDPRNPTVTETRMRYKVTKAPGSNSRSSRSFDKYAGHWIDNFAAKYHTRSTQSSLNSHEMYLGMSLRVSYDSRRKKPALSFLIVEHDSHEKDHNARYPF